MFDPNNKKNSNVIDYFAGRSLLIYEPVTMIRTTLKKMGTTFGFKNSNIEVADTIDIFCEKMEQFSSDYIFLNFEKSLEKALDILSRHLILKPNRLEAGFYFIAENNSLTFATLALDTEADGLFAKPFNMEQVQDSFHQSVLHKVKPTKYVEKVENGKKSMFTANPDAALGCFKDALALDKKPANAHYYQGAILKGSDEGKNDAIEELEKALTFNPKHYKSIKDLIEVYQTQGEYKKAYEKSRLLLEHFPVNLRKIPELTRLSILNQAYQDVMDYCEIFSQVEAGDENILKYLTAGLATCGHFFLYSNKNEDALRVYLDALKKSGGNQKVVESIIEQCTKNKAYTVADTVLKEIAKQYKESHLNHLSHYLLSLMRYGADLNICNEVAQNLYRSGCKIAIVYHAIIKSGIQKGKDKGGLSILVNEAKAKNPEASSEFEAYLT